MKRGHSQLSEEAVVVDLADSNIIVNAAESESFKAKGPDNIEESPVKKQKVIEETTTSDIVSGFGISQVKLELPQGSRLNSAAGNHDDVLAPKGKTGSTSTEEETSLLTVDNNIISLNDQLKALFDYKLPSIREKVLKHSETLADLENFKIWLSHSQKEPANQFPEQFRPLLSRFIQDYQKPLENLCQDVMNYFNHAFTKELVLAAIQVNGKLIDYGSKEHPILFWDSIHDNDLPQGDFRMQVLICRRERRTMKTKINQLQKQILDEQRKQKQFQKEEEKKQKEEERKQKEEERKQKEEEKKKQKEEEKKQKEEKKKQKEEEKKQKEEEKKQKLLRNFQAPKVQKSLMLLLRTAKKSLQSTLDWMAFPL